MRKILTILILLLSVIGYSQTRVQDKIEFPWTLRKVVNATDSVFNTAFDSIALGGGGEGGLTYDSLVVFNQNTMGVPLRSTIDTIYTKKQGDYSVLIGSSNDTIVISDDLGYNIYNGDTTNTISTVKWQNSDNTSQLYFKYADSVLPVNGIIDERKANIASLTRIGESGTFIDQILQINYGYSMPKNNSPTPPSIVNGIMASNNSYIDIIMDKDVYGANDGTTPVVLADFTATFTQGAGTATDWVADSITTNDTTTITAGEDTIRIWGTLTGTADGNETLEVTPFNGASIYESTGLAMSAGETTGAVSLNVGVAEFVQMTIATNNNVTVNGTTLVANTTVWNSSQVLYNETSVNNQITAFKVPNDAFDRSNVMLCLDVTNAIDDFANMDYAIYIAGGSFGIKYIYNSGSITPTGSTLTEGANTYIGYRRLSGNIEIVLSTDGGENWTQIHDFAVSDTRTLYVMTNQNGTGGGDIEIAEQK